MLSTSSHANRSGVVALHDGGERGNAVVPGSSSHPVRAAEWDACTHPGHGPDRMLRLRTRVLSDLTYSRIAMIRILRLKMLCNEER